MDEEKKVVFVSHCILNQYLKSSSQPRNELAEMLIDSKIGIVQLPCPKMDFDGKEKIKYKEHCKKISEDVTKTIKKYLKTNFQVIGILGVDFSPTCASFRVSNGRKVEFRKGVLIDEIEKQMHKQNFQVPIFSVNLSNVLPTIEKLNLLLKNS